MGYKEFFIVRHGKLDLPYKDHSEMDFEVLADLASLELNPDIDAEYTENKIQSAASQIPFGEIELIYTSPSSRTKQTASAVADFISEKYDRKLVPEVANELMEVKFDLKSMYSGKDKENINIEEINQEVFRSMLTGDYSDNYKELLLEIDNFFSSEELFEKGNKFLILSHDFLMRLIELYFKNNQKSDLSIDLKDLMETNRNIYFEGFRVVLEDGEQINFSLLSNY